MIRAVVFGGTAEGRQLCEASSGNAVPIIYCVATGDGARPVKALPNVEIHIGRLGVREMAEMLTQITPALVIDATHPYAREASRNIAAACQSEKVPLLRVARESAQEPDCLYFDGIDDLLARLEKEPGNIFVTTGSSRAGAFTGLTDFQERVWLRVLPSLDSLRVCLDWGYRPERLICMQGPFTEEMNRAMFKNANARILVTKNSGGAGGFAEKARAARSLGMLTAVLSRPNDPGGVSLEEACGRIAELGI